MQFSVSLGSKTFLSPISPPHSPSLSFPVRQWPEQSGSWGWRFQTPLKPLSATFLLTHSSLCTSLSLERKVNELRERERETRVTERKLCCTWNEQRIAHNVFFSLKNQFLSLFIQQKIVEIGSKISLENSQYNLSASLPEWCAIFAVNSSL